ncbi:MAG: hypothetical protein KA511_04465, partial [Brachymonas sp.]|nr:hypothetical protein [Brachymonas sp.]
MFNISLPSILILILLALNLLLVIALWLRKPDETLQEQTQQTLQQEVLDTIHHSNERLERELRRELLETSRSARLEQTQSLN